MYGTAAATRIFLPLVRQAVAGGERHERNQRKEGSGTKGRQPRIIFMSSIVGECDQALGGSRYKVGRTLRFAEVCCCVNLLSLHVVHLGITRYCLVLTTWVITCTTDQPPSIALPPHLSLPGRVSLPWVSVYAASKYAVEAMCDSLRLEVKPQGIQV